MTSRSLIPVAAALLVSVAACNDPGAPPGADLTPSSAASPAAAVTLTWRQASLGQAHTCGLTTDSLAYCWGWNELGQLGLGTTTESEPKPLPVTGSRRWRDIQGGDAHTCGIVRARRVFCWGTNFNGELGDGSTTQRTQPVAVATTLLFDQASTGSQHSCAVTAAGAAYCWGNNAYGQLGDGSRTRRLAPIKVLGNLTFRHVRAGRDHTCGVTTTDVAYCWGRNKSGQLGDGTTLTRGRPTAVAGNRKFRLIRTGQGHSCALTPAGQAYCWGLNMLGQVGDGSSLNERHTPVAVVNGAGFESIAAGSFLTCGVRTNRSAWCWGHNSSGQVGDGSSTTIIPTPVEVAGNHLWQRVNVGVTSQHACGVTTAGAAYCWGDNGRSQIGDGSTDERHVPTQVQDS
jgi:alpha-tubulin suppressor-like RCC1 family protein